MGQFQLYSPNGKLMIIHTVLSRSRARSYRKKRVHWGPIYEAGVLYSTPKNLLCQKRFYNDKKKNVLAQRFFI